MSTDCEVGLTFREYVLGIDVLCHGEKTSAPVVS